MIDREPVDIMGVTAFPNPNKIYTKKSGASPAFLLLQNLLLLRT